MSMAPTSQKSIDAPIIAPGFSFLNLCPENQRSNIASKVNERSLNKITTRGITTHTYGPEICNTLNGHNIVYPLLRSILAYSTILSLAKGLWAS